MFTTWILCTKTLILTLIALSCFFCTFHLSGFRISFIRFDSGSFQKLDLSEPTWWKLCEFEAKIALQKLKFHRWNSWSTEYWDTISVLSFHLEVCSTPQQLLRKLAKNFISKENSSKFAKFLFSMHRQYSTNNRCTVKNKAFTLVNSCLVALLNRLHMWGAQPQQSYSFGFVCLLFVVTLRFPLLFDCLQKTIVKLQIDEKIFNNILFENCCWAKNLQFAAL